jgi:hypothetical protein
MADGSESGPFQFGNTARNTDLNCQHNVKVAGLIINLSTATNNKDRTCLILNLSSATNNIRKNCTLCKD